MNSRFPKTVDWVRIVIVCCCMFSGNASANPPLIFAQIIDTPDQVIGAEILRVAYRELNVPVEILLMPGKRALIASNSGKIDGEVHRIYSVGENFTNLIRVETPINFIEPAIFTNNKSLVRIECSTLSDYTVGIVRGVQHSEACTHRHPNRTIVTSSKELMQLLSFGRVDTVVTAKLNGMLQLKKLNIKDVFILESSLQHQPVYHYLHKNHAQLADQVNTQFKKMLAHGELQTIRDNVLLKLLGEQDFLVYNKPSSRQL